MAAAPSIDTSPTPYGRAPLPPAGFVALAVALLALALIAALFYRSLMASVESSAGVSHTLSVLESLESLLSNVKDAETGQRGYLLTGQTTYLAPFQTAAPRAQAGLASLKELIGADPAQQQRLALLSKLVGAKMDELNATIALKQKGDGAAALAEVMTDRGRATMDQIRAVTADLMRVERNSLADREDELARTTRAALLWMIGACTLVALIVCGGAVVASRDYRARQRENWLRSGQIGLAEALQGDRRLEEAGADAVGYIASRIGAPLATLSKPAPGGALERVAAYGHAGDATPDDALGRQALADRRVIAVDDVPAGYFAVHSSLGNARPGALLVAPLVANGRAEGVAEFGFFGAAPDWARDYVARVTEPLAVAVRTAGDRTRLETLLEETQRQAEELQTQQEELRVTNEELEEQGNALKESAARLEEQRAELEQTNAHLEEQADALATQKQALADNQVTLRQRATALEEANRYKSEFLANMSHELRTPLNSTLILSKLLAENRGGNLTPEQTKFAQTIYSAGNDLLTLINDVLDLSKIEARKVELDVQPVNVRQLVESLRATLEPLAAQKGLELRIAVAPTVPVTIASDAQRVAQVLRNLLSNAIKFTDHGHVALDVARAGASSLRFAVRDTGIGIPADQQQVIFEAFRQADGSTHRKYGGTGLGLSISRDLATLLGGDVAVTSAPGVGSTFTLTLPVALDPLAAPRAGVPATQRTAAPQAAAATATHERAPREDNGWIADDRHALAPASRRLLVVEDDRRYAEVLRDLGRELGYQVIAAQTAGDGLDAARRHAPTAALLDINLPDQSGLALLDRFKRDPQLRAIPIHITSVLDYSRDALERGAIGYDVKPVTREQLVAALDRLAARAEQSVQRLLVVEDDARQRDSMVALLAMDGVEIVPVATAADAMAALRAGRFDCVVMDLNLPDVGGEDLLAELAASGIAPLPPVIVYTGRTLTGTEEQSLRRFANSIIVKGARSPERLLDEVTLFLHQVDAKLPPERQKMLEQVRGRDARLEGRRVLVAEDDVRNVFALASVLEPQGLVVQIARNGREAVDALAAAERGSAPPVDLVLMDIMMPEMDGLAAMRAIRERPAFRRLPIIALTAKAMPDDQQRCLAAGASDYIAKPLDADKLLSLLRVWMPRREA